jgi:two-component system OmpR family response regulator
MGGTTPTGVCMTRLLLVDDDADLRSLLSGFFQRHGYTVTVAEDGQGMFAALDKQKTDLVILDVMLPHEDGFSLCRRLRSTSNTPVIMLTAMADHTDRVVGLELGADDYLTKPFDQRELLARVKAVLRRVSAAGCGPKPEEIRSVVRFAGWCLDVVRRELRSPENALVWLSAGEFDLLLAFVEHARRVLSREQLIDLARGSTHVAYDRSIDVQVSRLRSKLEQDPRNPSLIRTIRNAGYMFLPEVQG